MADFDPNKPFDVVGQAPQSSQDFDPNKPSVNMGAQSSQDFDPNKPFEVAKAPEEGTDEWYKKNHPVVSTIAETLLNRPGPKGGPGMWTRAGQAVGLPTTTEEAEASKPQFGLKEAAETIGGPAYSAGKMVYEHGKQMLAGDKAGAEEIRQAGENIKAGQPLWPNIGKAAYGAAHSMLQSVPFVGAPIETMGEDVSAGNYRGAVGGGLAVVPQIMMGMEGHAEPKAAPTEVKPTTNLQRLGERTIGKLPEKVQPETIKNINRLENLLTKAQKEGAEAIANHEAHAASRAVGEAAPADVVKKAEAAKQKIADAEKHLRIAREAQQGVQPAPAPAMTLSPEQKLAQDTRQTPSPTDEELKSRQEKLMGDMEAKVGIEKPEAKPEVPAVRKPEPPPIMTAGEPERAPDMKGLKVDETGKVIDTTATETAAREALGTEAPGRKVPATEGVAMRPPFAKAPAEESPLAKYAPEEIAKREAAKPEVPVSEVPKVEAPKAEEAPKEVAERSPEDLSKVDTVIKELPNQDLIRHGSRFGVDETKYDFSKRVALREGGSKHPVEREAHANATLSALPEDLKNHIVDAANDWDAKNPKVFDPASYTNASRAERARAIMNEAMKRYQDGLAAKGVSGGSGAPDEGIGGLERWQGKNPLDKATVKPTADKVNLPADTDKEQPFEAGNQTWEDQLREARKTVNKGKAEAKAEKPKEVGGGTDKPERGGTEEGAKQDTAYFAQAKRELPDGGISDWAKRAQELKDKGDNPEVLETPKEFKEKPEEPKGSSEHTYEYKRDADSHQVTVRDKDGKSVALIEARAADDDPNTWTVKTSASAEKGEGLKGYTRLMDAAKSQAERSGKPVTVQGDTEMSASAVRTWVKLGRDYDIAWHRDNRPSITFRPSKMKY